MRKPSNKYTRLEADIKALKVGDTLSHLIRADLRMTAYDAARNNRVTLSIREHVFKKGKYEVTRVE